MFGYVLPQKSEMLVRDFENYRSYYCGVCKQLQQSYGIISRFLLNYDLVLLAVLADGISGETGSINCEGCFANPFAKRPTRFTTKGLALAADGLMMLSYHKLQDNLQDESISKKLLYSFAKPFMAHKYKKAAKKHPSLALTIEKAMQDQQCIEAAHSTSVDEAADPTAQMCAALFAQAAEDESTKRTLHRMGLFAGQIVYILDAAEDYDDDLAKGRYNVFVQAKKSKEEAIAAAQARCRMAAGEIALCYNLLSIRQNKAILDNIFFLGLPTGIAAAGYKRTGRPSKHGQITSV